MGLAPTPARVRFDPRTRARPLTAFARGAGTMNRGRGRAGAGHGSAGAGQGTADAGQEPRARAEGGLPIRGAAGRSVLD